MSYNDYLRNDVKKLETTLVCSLLDLANGAASKKLFEDLQLSDYANDLELESIVEMKTNVAGVDGH
jgi:hypothetical protein